MVVNKITLFYQNAGFPELSFWFVKRLLHYSLISCLHSSCIIHHGGRIITRAPVLQDMNYLCIKDRILPLQVLLTYCKNTYQFLLSLTQALLKKEKKDKGDYLLLISLTDALLEWFPNFFCQHFSMSRCFLYLELMSEVIYHPNMLLCK